MQNREPSTVSGFQSVFDRIKGFFTNIFPRTSFVPTSTVSSPIGIANQVSHESVLLDPQNVERLQSPPAVPVEQFKSMKTSAQAVENQESDYDSASTVAVQGSPPPSRHQPLWPFGGLRSTDRTPPPADRSRLRSVTCMPGTTRSIAHARSPSLQSSHGDGLHSTHSSMATRTRMSSIRHSVSVPGQSHRSSFNTHGRTTNRSSLRSASGMPTTVSMSSSGHSSLRPQQQHSRTSLNTLRSSSMPRRSSSLYLPTDNGHADKNGNCADHNLGCTKPSGKLVKRVVVVRDEVGMEKCHLLICMLNKLRASGCKVYVNKQEHHVDISGFDEESVVQVLKLILIA